MSHFLCPKAKGSSSFDTLPGEMVVHILSFVDVDDLLTCRLVCSQWYTLIDNVVFREKASRENDLAYNGRGFYSFSEVQSSEVKKLDLPWFVFHTIVKYDPFNRNMVRNHCGQDGCDHWSEFYKLFTCEQAPLLHNIPDYDGYPSCFVADNGGFNFKTQAIFFKNYGLSDIVMQSLEPSIILSEWFSTCSCNNLTSVLRLKEYNSNHEELFRYECNYNTVFKDSGIGWKKRNATHLTVNHFSFPMFNLEEMNMNHDCSFKVTGTTVKVLLPIKLKCS